MLCIMNLMPLPVLDGGTLLLCLVEGIRRKPLSHKAQVALQNVGIALLGGLMLLVIYFDLLRLPLLARLFHHP
jgi:regulator of sigma E protease